MNITFAIDPLFSWPVLVALGVAAIAVAILAVRARMRGILFRVAGSILLIMGLINPVLDIVKTDALHDFFFAFVDNSASQSIGNRLERTEAAFSALEASAEQYPSMALRRVEVGNSLHGDGTNLFAAAVRELANVGKNRVAGAVFITDGLISGQTDALDLDVPTHILLSGQRDEWDRRVRVVAAPAFALVGEPFTISFRVEDDRNPSGGSGTVPATITLNGEITELVRAPIGKDTSVSLTSPRAGSNSVLISTPGQQGELTDVNNSSLLQLTGVRDRLKVLMISGKPHAGQRTWRNLLKSDGAVDLVHFTILRGLADDPKADVGELALIEFPVRELFVDKLDSFDLIIFDRYERLGFLEEVYFQFLVRYVENGGGILISAGPEFAGSTSLSGTDLRAVLPAVPTGTVFEEGFRPRVTRIGMRHPVTATLPGYDRLTSDDAVAGNWGRWFRHVDIELSGGKSLMVGARERPLLAVRRVGEGRVALLASDQAWLWHRGVEGGGPQLELLRRLAHWMLREPGLEEESLLANFEGGRLNLLRRTLAMNAPVFEILGPDGTGLEIAANKLAPGEFEAVFPDPQPGRYRIRSGELEIHAAVGTEFPSEFKKTVPDTEIMDSLEKLSGGSVNWIIDGTPELRPVRSGRSAFGRDWIGFTPRNQKLTLETVGYELVSGLLAAMLIVMLAALAWWNESGKRWPFKRRAMSHQ